MHIPSAIRNARVNCSMFSSKIHVCGSVSMLLFALSREHSHIPIASPGYRNPTSELIVARFEGEAVRPVGDR